MPIFVGDFKTILVGICFFVGLVVLFKGMGSGGGKGGNGGSSSGRTGSNNNNSTGSGTTGQ